MQDNRTRAPNRRSALVTTGALSLGLGMSLAGCGGGNTEADEDPPVAPTLTISSDTPGVAAAAFTVNFRFSAGASGFGTDKLVVSGGSIVGGSFTSSSSSAYSVLVQPTANRVGQVEVRVAAGGFSDSTGASASTRAYSFVQACNTVVPAGEPVLTITDNVAGGAQATGAVVFALAFSLPIRNTFSLVNITVAGGTASGFIRVSESLYNVTLTPPAGTTGSMLLRVPANAYTGETSGLANTVETLAGVAFQTA